MISVLKRYFKTLGIIGLLLAIKSKIFKTTSYYQIKRTDCLHPFMLRIHSSDVRVYEQVFLNQEYDFKVKKTPKIIIDAGANIGFASIYFANKFPNAKIIAIEPEQSNFDLMINNVASYRNIIPIQAALWNKNEEINIIDSGLGKWGFKTEARGALKKDTESVCHSIMGITITKLMTDFSISKIDILKIDIEGAEKEVFSDTSSWIEKIDAIIVELHDYLKIGCNRSFYLGTNGFENEWRKGENVYLSRNNCLMDAYQKT